MSNTFTVSAEKPLPPMFLRGETVIPKKELVDGQYYAGHCRNAKQAVWRATKERFEYIRHKFSYQFVEEINHFEDFKGFDVFWPTHALQPTEVIWPIAEQQAAPRTIPTAIG